MSHPTTRIVACGETAASRLAPYEKRISGNFEICRCVGKLIAAWDRPEFIEAAAARHMRDDDYVVGVEHRGQFRAYPLWITDNYHMINDNLAGDPILFSTCERCQSGSAFIRRLDGKTVSFSAIGMYNASLTMVNRRRGSKGEKPSTWLHYEGVAIHGPRTGQFLEQLPAFHMVWRDWVALHPETDVMLPTKDPHHRDGRHGHGREEYFSRPGMDPPLAKTITGRFDCRYAENEMVLGVNVDAGLKAYPRLEVARQGGVVNDVLGDLRLVVFGGPKPGQCAMAAYLREAGGQTLTFESLPDGFRDLETGSLWTIEGRAVDGPLAGSRLTPVRWQYVRYHAWVYPHPDTALYLSDLGMPTYPEFPACAEVQALREPLESLAALGAEVRFSNVILDLRLPQEATHGVCVQVGDDRLNLYRFSSAAAAQDYVELEGAWFCWPFDAKLARRRAHRAGRFVLESDPLETYAEPTQTVRFPDNQIPWSGLVNDAERAAAWAEGVQPEPVEGRRFVALAQHLKASGIDVVEVAYLPASQLRVGARSGVAATIEGDRFAIYRCVSKEAAEQVEQDVPQAFRVGEWVFRSIPVLMYQDPHYEMGQLPDKKIEWSPLVEDARLHKIIAAYDAS